MKKIMILCFALSLVCAGCAAFQKQGSEPAPASKTQGFNQAFYGFPDVPVPKELDIVNDRSFVYETPTFKAGVIVFSGNVDPASVESYYKLNMAKNGWKAEEAVIAGFMNFAKDNRNVQIIIQAQDGQTAVVVVEE